MNALLQDLRYARRILVKSPLFTAIVVVTLAIGIGLNTAVFSAIDTLILKPLPGVRAPDEIMQLYRSYPGPELYGSNSVPHFQDVRDQSSQVFSSVSAWTWEQMSLSSGGRASAVFGMATSANFFSMYGVNPFRGRMFVPAEDSGANAHPVAVVSYQGWQHLFGGDPEIVGRTVIIDGSTYSIIGITPEAFHGPQPIAVPDFYVPLTQINQLDPSANDKLTARDNNFMNVRARLRPGVNIAQARDRLNSIVAQLTAKYPDSYKNTGITIISQRDGGLYPTIHGAEVSLSAVVMAVVALLLLIACVNIANLFLARARDRAREMAIRLSLGARRAVLIRQLLIESLMFSTVSGAAGLAVAWWAIGLANQISLPMDVNFQPNLSISPLVLLFTLGVTVVTGVLFGLAPALQATKPSLVPALKGEEAAGESRSKATRVLVVAQVALSIILLVSAGLFLRNLKAATNVYKGFDSNNVLIASVDPGLQGYSRARAQEFYRQLTDRMSANPDITAIGFSNSLPLGLGENDNGVRIPGYTPGKNEGMSIQVAAVTPGYFTAMGIPLREGRAFRAQDDSTAPGVMIINERFAQRFWPGQDALGKTVHVHGHDNTVVGIVPTGKYQRLGEDPTAFMYFPQQQSWSFGMTMVIRTRNAPDAVVPALRAEVSALDPNMPLSDVRTMDSHLGIALLPARLTGWVLGVFGIIGLLLASVGIYGVMAYSVSQRTREIGIRMAIGAGGGQVLRLLMRQGLTLVLIGTGFGLVGATGAAMAIRGQLYGGTGLDPVTFVAVPLVLIVVAMGAIWIPAKRAAGLDPVLALRQD